MSKLTAVIISLCVLSSFGGSIQQQIIDDAASVSESASAIKGAIDELNEAAKELADAVKELEESAKYDPNDVWSDYGEKVESSIKTFTDRINEANRKVEAAKKTLEGYESEGKKHSEDIEAALSALRSALAQLQADYKKQLEYIYQSSVYATKQWCLENLRRSGVDYHGVIYIGKCGCIRELVESGAVQARADYYEVYNRLAPDLERYLRIPKTEYGNVP